MHPRNSRSTSVPSLARASSVALALGLAACAADTGRGLVVGQSTQQDVEKVLGQPAETQPGPGGEKIYWYPKLPWGHISYRVRIGADGHLLGAEQRLTEGNIKKVVPGQTTAKEVHDLLGPCYRPTRYEGMERDIWTYPMRVPGYQLPKWFLVQMSYDGIVRETYLMDDPQFVPMDRGGSRSH